MSWFLMLSTHPETLGYCKRLQRLEPQWLAVLRCSSGRRLVSSNCSPMDQVVILLSSPHDQCSIGYTLFLTHKFTLLTIARSGFQLIEFQLNECEGPILKMLKVSGNYMLLFQVSVSDPSFVIGLLVLVQIMRGGIVTEGRKKKSITAQVLIKNKKIIIKCFYQ